MPTVQSDTNSAGGNNLRQRLARGLSATSLNPIITAIVQLGSVPLLLHIWGAAKYGDWLLLSAIPSYLTLSDLGFGNASGSDMPMRVAANDREGALGTFQSSWVLVTLSSLAAFLLASVFVWWIPWQSWLKLSSVSNNNAATILLVLAAYVVISQQDGIAESGYRSDGKFATGTFWIAILRLAEAVAATAVAVFGGSLLAVAFTYLIVRCMGTVAYILFLRHLSPWIRYGIHHARTTTMKQMVAPAFGFIALPLGNALSLQGLLVVIGITLGPIAVVSFSTLRTLSRLTYQLIGVVKNALWPELSKAFGEGDISLARRLHRRACQASLGLSISGGIFLWLFGPLVYGLWIRQNVGFNASCFHILLLVAVTNSFWDTSSVIPMSTNAHCRISLCYCVLATLTLGVAWVLVPLLGIAGAAVALLFADGWMSAFVLTTALHQVHDDFKEFVVALANRRIWQALRPVTEG